MGTSSSPQTELTSTLAQGAPDAAGYGARLAAQRARMGLSVTDVAATLRLHPNQVRAMEEEDLTRLPALAYVRGFIRSYARVLNLDPEPLLADLNAKLTPGRESVVDGMATDFAAARAAGRERMFPQWAVGIALVILIALGVIGWQTTLQPAPAPPHDRGSCGHCSRVRSKAGSSDRDGDAGRTQRGRANFYCGDRTGSNAG